MEKGTLPGAQRFCWGLNAARGGLGCEAQEVDTEEFAQALQKQPPRGGGLEHRARDPGLRMRGRGSRRQHPTGDRSDPVTQLEAHRTEAVQGKGPEEKKWPGEGQAELIVFKEFQNRADRVSGSYFLGIKGV